MLFDQELAIFNVIGTSGEPHLGGEDIDRVIIDHLVSSFLTKTNLDLLETKKGESEQVRKEKGLALARIRQGAERVRTIQNAKLSPSLIMHHLATSVEDPAEQ